MTTCKGCGRKIMWGQTPEGKTIPLDVSAPVYSIIREGETAQIVRTQLALVSHFATCAKANDFSANKRNP